MNNALLQISIKERLNKLASFDYDNLECWMIQEAFNKAQLEFVRRMVYGMNLRKEGAETSRGLVDDLRVLVTAQDLRFKHYQEFCEAELPKDYLYYVRTDVHAKSDCCPKRRMTVYEVEEANVSLVLNSTDRGPSFEWAETVSTLLGNKLRIYTDQQFQITDVHLVYYRLPRPVQIKGCIDPETRQLFTQDQTCEFPEDVIQVLLDETAAVLAGDIESAQQYPRLTQNAQRNS